MSRAIIWGCLLAVISTPQAKSYTLFESASLGPTGIEGGWEISYLQFTGVRFQVTSPTVTTEVGGHLYETTFPSFPNYPSGNHKIFGAIVALSGPGDVPNSFDLSTPDVLGVTLLQPPLLSAEVSAPLSVNLIPGWYTLVFGSGLFGATGHAALTFNNVDIGHPSYYVQYAGQYSAGRPDMRFFVNAVPEPTSATLLLLGMLGFATSRRKTSSNNRV